MPLEVSELTSCNTRHVNNENKKRMYSLEAGVEPAFLLLTHARMRRPATEALARCTAVCHVE